MKRASYGLAVFSLGEFKRASFEFEHAKSGAMKTQHGKHVHPRRCFHAQQPPEGPAGLQVSPSPEHGQGRPRGEILGARAGLEGVSSGLAREKRGQRIFSRNEKYLVKNPA